MSFLDFFVLFVLIVIAIVYFKNILSEVEYVESDVDGKKYLVLKLSDKQQAANTIAHLIKDMKKLISHLKEKHPDNPSVKRLVKNFNDNEISEGSPTSGYTSYTINKGKMILCIRQKDKNKTLITDRNLLRYVVFHELGHIASKSVGHNEEFWKTFKFILNEAVVIGLYDKVDYASNPQPYCGIKVTSSVI
jgi:uncharacterized short protein YbdD (DUF466 family)